MGVVVATRPDAVRLYFGHNDVWDIRVGEDTLEDVKSHGKALESEVLARAVQLFVTDQLVVKDKKVIFRPGMSPAS